GVVDRDRPDGIASDDDAGRVDRDVDVEGESADGRGDAEGHRDEAGAGQHEQFLPAESRADHPGDEADGADGPAQYGDRRRPADHAGWRSSASVGGASSDRMRSRTASTVIPSKTASGVRRTRWPRTAWASDLMSSG